MQYAESRARAIPLFKPTLLSLMIAGATFSLQLQANPVGPNVVRGSATINQSVPGNLNITNSPGAIINWQGFSIQQNEVTRFLQQNNQSAVLNRVIGADPSQIMGQLISNGQVLLINPNGILFGAGSMVDTAGFLASTLDLSNADFLSGNYHFIAGDGAGDIRNEGIIRAGDNGNIILIAPNIKNSGVIETGGGQITLAAGEQLTITSLDDPRIRFQVQAPEHEVLNVGQLLTKGGAANLFGGTLTHSGEINANSVEVDDQGRIWLRAKADINLAEGSRLSANNAGGTAGEILIETEGTGVEGDVSVVTHQGTIEAKGSRGGSITINSESLFSAGDIDVSGEAVGGDVSITLEKRLLATEGDSVTADAATGVAGTIHVKAGESIYSSASYSAQGGSGGGRVVITAPEVKLSSAEVDVSADKQGGDIRIGGGFKGEESAITNAETVTVNHDTQLRADARTDGDGGSVVVWADETTRFGGYISATGGSEGGDGGEAEVSGAGELGYYGVVNLSAPYGLAGSLILDPKNITITTGTASTVTKTELVDPNPGAGDFFGSNRTILSNDFIAIRQEYDDFGGTDAGAFYVFNPDTGALAYSLVGANAGDRVGHDGIYNLSGGYLLRSSLFNGGAGAVTYFTAADGVNGTLSSSNSLVGALSTDAIGGLTPWSLGGGKYILRSQNWGNNQGAWTWFDSNNDLLANGQPIAGVIGAANSLIGGTGGDTGASQSSTFNFGSNIYALYNSYWDSPSGNDAGAFTLFNANTGKFLDGSNFLGTISATNSLVGSSAGDRVGYYSPYYVGGGYFLRIPHWNGNEGAWTWFDPFGNQLANAQPVVGAISAANSLVGGTAGASPDTSASLWSYGSSRYALNNSYWDSPITNDAGAVVLFNGQTGTFLHDGSALLGTISSANALVGDHSNDRVGAQLYNLGGSRFLIRSDSWDSHHGAWTWVDLNTNQLADGSGITGVIGATNSLIGQVSETADNTAGIYSLGSSIYAVNNSYWDNFSSPDAGAVTLFNAVTGNFLDGTDFVGTVSSNNSLVGTNTNDRVGVGGINSIDGNKYMIMSPYWGTNQGAWTWIDPVNNQIADGDSMITGIIGQTNSFVGGNGGDTSGSFANIYSLGSGRYALINPDWDAFNELNAGAITIFNGSAGTKIDNDTLLGDINSENSLIGSSQGDRVGSSGRQYVGGGYLFMSESWGNNQGAWTWFDPTSGTLANGQIAAGIVGGGNSLIGGTGGDTSSSYASTSSVGGGKYLLYNTHWDSSSALNAGAVTLFDGVSGKFADGTNLVGALSSSNSLIGGGANDLVGNGLTYVGGGYLIRSPNWGNNQGAWTWFDPATGLMADGSSLAGVVGATNSLLGGEGGDSSGSFINTYNLGSGKYLIYNDDWDGPGAAYNAGAVTLIDGLNGNFIDGSNLVGTISSSNSLVGSSANDRISYWGVWNMGGGLLIQSPQWDSGQGAWTWLNTSTYETAAAQPFVGVVGAGNSLVGGTTGDGGVSNNIRGLDSNLYVLLNREWDTASATDVGAITVFNGSTGKFLDGSNLLGAVSSSNSLVGSSTDDRVGYDYTNLSGALMVESPLWGNNQGAWTWINRSNGLLSNGASPTGIVSASNSLVGGTGGDTNGSFANFYSVGSGMYVMYNRYWDSASAMDAGAVSLFNSSTGKFADGSNLLGTVSSSNSLVGSSANDRVGYYSPTNVGTGYMLRHPYWGDNQGAWTWFNPSTGLLADGSTFKGVLSASNSLVGGTGGDTNGSFANIWSIGSGNTFLYNRDWDGPGIEDAGAVTLFNGNTGTFFSGGALVGTISAANSYVGESAFDNLSSAGIQTLINGQRYAIFSHNYDSSGLTDSGRIFILDISAATGTPISNSLFGDSSSTDEQISSSSVEATLNQGTNLVLQANNDLTVVDAIEVNNPSGDGGNLTLQAGRNLSVNDDILTDNGDLTLVANDQNAQSADRDAGTGNINIASGTTVNGGAGNIILRIGTGVTPGDINVSGSLLTSTGNITLDNQAVGRGINLLSTAIINAGTSTTTNQSDVYFTADGLAITAGGQVIGRTFNLQPTSTTYTLGIGGGTGSLNLTEAELNALNFSQIVTLNSGTAGGDINIGSYTSTQSPNFYRFLARDNLTVSNGMSVPNALYLSVDYNDNSIDTMDLNGSFSASLLNLYSAGTGGTTYNDILNLPDTNNTLTLGSPNATIDFAGTTGNAYRFGSMTGGSLADSFNVSGTNVLTSIDGGAGSDTFDYTGYTSPITVDLQAGTTPNVAAFSSIENFIGGSGDDTFLLNNANYTINSIVGGGGTDTVTQTAGTLSLAGNLDVEVYSMSGGSLGGTGTINGNIALTGGTMSVGNSPGQLTINGNYSQNANVTFVAELGGTTQGTNYDFLDVTGTVTLDGTLDVTLFGGYQPQYLDTFDIIRSQGGNIVGDFTTTNLPAGYDWSSNVVGNLYQIINNSQTSTTTQTATTTQTSQIVTLTEQGGTTAPLQLAANDPVSTDPQSQLVDETQTTPTTGELVDETQTTSTTGELVDETQTSSEGELVDQTTDTASPSTETELSGGNVLLLVDLFPPSEMPSSGLPLPDPESVSLEEAIETINTTEYTPVDRAEFYNLLEEDQVITDLYEAGWDELAAFFSETSLGGATSESELITILNEEGASEEEKISYLGVFARMRHIGMSKLLAEALEKLKVDPDLADVFNDGESGKPIDIRLSQQSFSSENGLVKVEGVVSSESKLLYLGINDRWVFVDDQGRFSTELAVPAGDSSLKLLASDVEGVTTSATVSVRSQQNGQQPITEGKRIALLIGVEEYDNAIPELDTPVADVAAVSAKIKQEQGFDTRVMANPTKQEILDTLQELASELGEDDSLMVYYAGHGYQLEETGRGYWLPRDAETNDPRNWVSNRDIARLFHRTPAKQVLLVSDSCYSGAFTRGKQVQALAENDPRTLRAVMAMSSGGEQPVWDGGGDGHSIFASHFIDTLQNGEIKGLPFYRQVHDKVVREAPQVPGYGAMVLPGYDKGADFVLGENP